MAKRVKHSNKSTKKETHREKSPQVKKETKQEIDPGNYDSMKASWRFHRTWNISRWPINVNNWKDWHEEIIPKLIEFQEQTWAEIKGPKNHNVNIDGLTRDGKKEIENLQLFIDGVFSLRLTGKKRLIGILDRGVLEILCYTPQHEFTKTNKRHT